MKTVTKPIARRLVSSIAIMGLVLLTLVGISSRPAYADAGNILPPFDIGQSWNICQGYNNPAVTHTGTSLYGLDLTGGGCGNTAAGRNVRASISGTVSYYEAKFGNLCINTAGGRSYTLTHINATVTSGNVTAGQIVGTVAGPTNNTATTSVPPNNNNLAHIHFQIWASPNCYNSYAIPFDVAHNARICGAPDLTVSGPNGGNGTWSGTSITGANCGQGSDTIPSYSDGSFLAVNGVGTVYRVIGGAPIRQYNQGAISDFNGGSVTWVNQADIDKMPTYPADGSWVSIAEANGNGIYRFVGGAPIRQFNWGAVPGYDPNKVWKINHTSMVNLDHMRSQPVDGSWVSIAEANGNGIYRFVGGAPIRQFNWGAIPDYNSAAVVNINSQSLSVLDHMNPIPADGSFVNIAEAGGSGIYRFVGGAPIRLYNQGVVPGFTGYAVWVNSQSVTDLDHMNLNPNDGSWLASSESGIVYRVAGGTALRLYDHGSLPGFSSASVVMVNQASIDNRDHLGASPKNGTILKGYPSGGYWLITSGKRVTTSANTAAVEVNDQTVSDIPIG